MVERQEYLMRHSRVETETTSSEHPSSSFDQKEEKSEKKSKRSKKKHKKERDKRRDEKSGSKKKEEKDKNGEDRNGGTGSVRKEAGTSHKPVSDEKVNHELREELNSQREEGDRVVKETFQTESLNSLEEANQATVGQNEEVEAKQTTVEQNEELEAKLTSVEQPEELEDSFDDFDEDKLSTLSTSSLSLSSIDDDSQEKIGTPIDGWRYGPVNSRKSRSPPPPPLTFQRQIRPQSRSRSHSRPFEDRKSNSRSISPPNYLPKVGAHSWESRVSEFVRSIGGDPRQKASISFLESVATSSAPIQLPSNFAINYRLIPPPPIISYPATVLPSATNAPFSARISPPPIGPPSTSNSLMNAPQLLPSREVLGDTIFQNQIKPKPVSLVHAELPIEDEYLPPDEIVLTPLIKFIGQKLSDKKLTHLSSLKEGIFRYNLLSVVSRGEWVAAKVLETFDKFGFSESSMYNTAALKGRQGFKEYLRTAISSQKVSFGHWTLTSQDLKLIHCVVDLIVKYFTFDGTENDEEEFDFEEENDQPGSDVVQTTCRTGGVAEIVKNLSQQAEPVRTSPECPEQPDQPPINPWSNMWNWMQSENFKTFLDLKKNLAKGFLGSVGTSKFGKNPFVAAQDLVSCWVIAGSTIFFLFSLTLFLFELI
jgi:hypothetical protein